MKQIYDVVVIGGGPAGMMAAGRAAELGASVVLLEKNEKLGKKLLITGGGRCNITNAEFDIRKMVAKYGSKGKALFGSFARFGVQETFDFFTSKDLPLKVEAELRAFPVSNRAEDVWKTLHKYMQSGKVKILLSAAMQHFVVEEGKIVGVQLRSEVVYAKSFIMATGGKSRPETGSTGEGFGFLREVGHTIEDQASALVPITIAENWAKQLSGVSFVRAGLSVFQDGKKQNSGIGKLLFTHFGISGPLALNLSKSVADIFRYGPVELFVDLYPEVDIQSLDKRVLDIFAKYINKKIKNSLGEVMPPKMIPALLALAGIDPEKEVNALPREERLRLLKLVKAVPLTVTGLLGTEKAIVTSGGVSLKDIDFKTMQSKVHSNLFLAGDVLNFDRPSGGFSLQICWTTGYLAGENAAVT